MRYSFSGHESFHCKSLWLKKGYDYLLSGGKFSDINAVMLMGVGKNMVASIRFWLKAFGLTKDDTLTPLAHYFFEDGRGKDMFCEDIATLWLLHYHLVKAETASIYHLLFVDFQRERKEFDLHQLQAFIKRKCNVPEQKNVYNESTVKKDIGVLINNYVRPRDLSNIERFTALLIELGLLRETEKGHYSFNETREENFPNEILLYMIADIAEGDHTVSFDKLHALSLMLCIPISSFLDALSQLATHCSDTVAFTDNSGVRNIQILRDVDKFEILDRYYKK